MSLLCGSVCGPLFFLTSHCNARVRIIQMWAALLGVRNLWFNGRVTRDMAVRNDRRGMRARTTSPPAHSSSTASLCFRQLPRTCTYLKNILVVPLGDGATTEMCNHGFCALRPMCVIAHSPFLASDGGTCIYTFPFPLSFLGLPRLWCCPLAL